LYFDGEAGILLTEYLQPRKLKRSMSLLRACLPAAVASFLLVSSGFAETTILYLLNGTVVRGEIVERSAKLVKLKTSSGVTKVKTATLMPISRQQLKLPAEIEKEEMTSPETEALLGQMEKLVAENEALKKQIAELQAQLEKPAAVPAEAAVTKR
jgi:transcriptional regulator of aromatic amino acid metabolism